MQGFSKCQASSVNMVAGGEAAIGAPVCTVVGQVDGGVELGRPAEALQGESL